jgi:hypothetical protein
MRMWAFVNFYLIGANKKAGNLHTTNELERLPREQNEMA